MVAKLGSAANEDWRLVFSALAVELHVTERGDIEVALAIPVEKPAIVFTTPRDAEHNQAFPLRFAVALASRRREGAYAGPG